MERPENFVLKPIGRVHCFVKERADNCWGGVVSTVELDADWPKMGICAQGSKDRPNRIGITVCKIESVNALKIRVSELDAVDGTPVLDVKPYFKGLPRAAECVSRPGPAN
jgi:tRNA-methyltransferase O